MAAKPPSSIVSHWYHLIDGLQTSPLKFYEAVETAITKRQAPDAKASRVQWREGGMFSAKREYLRIQRQKLVFDICGAPFGRGFFISWWLGELPSGVAAFAGMFPVVGSFVQDVFRPSTYYKIDSALMFGEMIHGGVLEVCDAMTTASGIRTLSDLERKPVLRDFYRK